MSSNTTSADAFDKTAIGYDASRRQLIPCYDAFYGTALELLSEIDTPEGSLHIIDLGAGTGLMSAMILDRFPRAHLTLVDGAENMLELARHRIANEAHRVELVVADFLGHWSQGPYDAVVSALAIHHLTHEDKRTLFGRIYDVLRAGGCFINADQVCGATDRIDNELREGWLRQVKENRVSEAALSAALGRMRHDIPARLDDQLEWLAEAGFDRVGCAFDGGMFAVYCGWRQ